MAHIDKEFRRHGAVGVHADHSELHALLDALAERDVAERRRARRALVAIGREAIPGLGELLARGSFEARWEAALALGEIAVPEAVPALVLGLRDKEPDVRWLSAEGLISIGRPAVAPLLRSLIQHGESIELRRAAHHVIHDLKDRRLRAQLEPVLRTLSGVGDGLDVISEAGRALQALRMN